MTQLSRMRGPLAILLFVSCMPMTSNGQATAYPVSAVAADADCHGSIREAAAAGIIVAAALSRTVEYGGAVLQRGARCFVYTAPVTTNQPSSVEYTIQFARGKMRLAGIYHTHTHGRHAGEFSPHDSVEQRRLGVPSYLGVISTQSGEAMIRALGEAADGLSASAVRASAVVTMGAGQFPLATAGVSRGPEAP